MQRNIKKAALGGAFSLVISGLLVGGATLSSGAGWASSLQRSSQALPEPEQVFQSWESDPLPTDEQVRASAQHPTSIKTSALPASATVHLERVERQVRPLAKAKKALKSKLARNKKPAHASKLAAKSTPPLSVRVAKLEDQLEHIGREPAAPPKTLDEATLPAPTEIKATVQMPGQAGSQKKPEAIPAPPPAFDAVPDDQMGPLQTRLKIVTEIIQKYGRAYDYRSLTVEQLEKIKASLDASSADKAQAPKSAPPVTAAMSTPSSELREEPGIAPLQQRESGQITPVSALPAPEEFEHPSGTETPPYVD